ncbi:hypothetical protein DFQ28_008568 [Apophysomyces sp. BC1034]|nr:hypothetical protein DFQ30_008155 [Apophysomyces sp. BC1015]KAG0175453.1 hypothetical protein DFQ29_007143 [Apophysomyces sp. BC1021]KAG0185912.1 hypothetical protein DFQ28_008568 [Apophysomyces sp. BC1034]
MSTSKSGYNSIPTPDDDLGTATTSRKPDLITRVKRSPAALGILAGAALAAGFFLSVLLPDGTSVHPHHNVKVVQAGISDITMQEGLLKCQNLHRIKQFSEKKGRRNPRAHHIAPVLLKNAVVWDGQGGVLNDVDILLEEGVIKDVRHQIQVAHDVKVIDVKGHVVSPGLVDMHSHLGVDSWPVLDGTSDTNEMTMPLTPFVRSLDAFNPSDKAIRIVASGGITTALVLPGSGNSMGGEAFAFKLRPVATTSNEDMLVQAGIDEDEEPKRRYMKWACGENPKRVYGGRGRIPSTRLGEAFIVRQRLAEAQNLKRQQNDWCSAASNAGKAHLDVPFPEDISLESLVALLRGDVHLNIHCYETHDIEAMVRHSLEFNFTIAAFHHALDAYRIPDILKRARGNVTVATFADHWGYKKEAFQASPHAPKILVDAGIPVAFKSDHPVLNAQHLAFEAAKAHHHGLKQQEAFKAVTSVPAHALGLGHRIGSLKVGYDADIVVWDREPLELGASPLQVFVDGTALFEERPFTPPTAKQEPKTVAFDEQNGTEGSTTFVLSNVGSILLDELHKNVQVAVENGKIICVAQDCSNTVKFMSQGQIQNIDIQGGYVTPGLVAVGSSLGLVEIPSESSTVDGTSKPSDSHDPKAILQAVDGIKLGTRHLEEAYKGGILTAITAPVSDNVVVGVSTAFKTSADSLLTNGSLVSPAVALHLQLGDTYKSDTFPTVSSQINFIRQILTENIDADNHYGQAARGEITTVISVHNKDEIASLIRLKQTDVPKARFAILGGAESYLIARYLAEADIAVILLPALCTPAQFDSIHCLTGAPLSNGTAAHVLHQHGVKIGVGVSDDGLARNLAWDAGWLVPTDPSQDLSEAQAIRFISSNLLEIFGLQNKNAAGADDFVVWSGSPLDIQSRRVLVHSNNGIHWFE